MSTEMVTFAIVEVIHLFINMKRGNMKSSPPGSKFPWVDSTFHSVRLGKREILFANY